MSTLSNETTTCIELPSASPSEEEGETSSLTQQSPSSFPEASPQLSRTLKCLFALNGATYKVPSLALLAIVNDRVAIPPAYLPAYGAISFLPHSLKPFYAALSIAKRHPEAYTNLLLSILLALSGLCYLGTAFLIPERGVVSCFAWGFLRGMTSAWSQFLMDQCLIRQAQTLSRESTTGSSRYPQHDTSYQALASLFQSQAATYRHGGSTLASIAILSVFAWRQQQGAREGNAAALSDAVVMALLLGTAMIQFGGSLLIALESDWKSTIFTSMAGPSGQPSSANHRRQQNEQCYEALATNEDLDSDSSSFNVATTRTLEDGTSEDREEPRTPNRRQRTAREYSDVASLVLLQTLLVGAALKRPILSLPHGATVWTPIMVLTATCLMVAVLISSCSRPGDENNHQSPGNVGTTTTEHHPIPARRLGLYLILRHSVPIASILMYSYVYTIFGTDEPLFLQFLFVVESAVSVFANWTYGKYLAKFHSGWSLIVLIAILSIVSSLVSSLDVLVVHVANHKTAIDTRLRWLVVGVSVVAYFMGQVGYMPSVVLSTANVVSSGPTKEGSIQTETTADPPSNGESSGGKGQDSPMVHDEGVQYATFVACIDFGAQLGDWISVPIITAYGITRENNWDNLDKYIVLCAMLRIASVAFLCLLRPKPLPSPSWALNAQVV